MSQKIVQLRDRFKSEAHENSADIEQFFPGFSVRFNIFLELCELEEPIPPLGDGRVNFLVELFDTNRISVAQWLNKDMPPKTTTLRRIVRFLLKYIPGGDYHPVKVEAWLKYGEQAVRNPFVLHKTDRLTPLAHTLINTISHEIGIPPASIMFERALNETLQYLKSLQLPNPPSVSLDQERIVAQIIRNNAKNV